MPSERPVLPADVLAAALHTDATRPRLTFYDDAPGPTRGERIELSAKVLTNWVSKAGNALQEELDVAPGSRVLLDLPVHWRAVYWALAVWSVGATLVLPQGDSPSGSGTPRLALDDLALLVSNDLELVESAVSGCERPGGPMAAVLVSLPMLARAHPADSDGVFDEARELATYGDVFDAWEIPSVGDPALVVTSNSSGGRADSTSYGALVTPRSEWGDRPRVELAGSLRRVLLDALSAWYADGSVVLVREPDGDGESRRTSEGVTVRLR